MLKRSGTEAYCAKCEKWRPIEGREKEDNSHQHWCRECIEMQREESKQHDIAQPRLS